MAENNKDFDAILYEITSGLTGDAKADVAFLQGQMEKYKDHEMGKEIIRACARLVYDLIPDDKKAEFEKLINNSRSGTEAALEEVRFNIYKKDYEKALSIIEALVKKTEALNAYQDDQVTEYHVFNELFEEVLYRFREKPEKELRQAGIPYTEMYMLYGNLLFELNRLEDARVALKKGLRWNPISFDIMSEYVETFKMTGDFDQFFDLTVDAFKIAFKSKDVARCYRNLGYYFVEKQLYSEAMAVYLLSLQYDRDSKSAQSELYYINAKTNGKIKEPSAVEAKEYADKYGFPMGADEDILGLSYSYGKYYFE